jgi:hypothetical protein
MGKVNQPSDIVSEFRALKQFVSDLAKRVGLSSATISRGGLRIIDGGKFELVDADGTSTAYFGPLVQGDDTSTGWTFRFDNGGLAFTLSGPPGSQFWTLRDNAGNIVASNDAASGVGLARPYFNYRLVPSLSAQSFGEGSGSMWPSTASTSYIGLLEGDNTIWNPRIAYRIVTTTAASGDVEWQFRVGSTVVASGVGTASGVVDVPGWGTTITPDAEVNLSVHGRLTSSTASRGWLQLTRCYGYQS